VSEYDQMDHAQLREAADARGLDVPDDASEDQLRQALSEPQPEAEASAEPAPTGDPGTSGDNLPNTATTPSSIQAGPLSDFGEGQTLGSQDPALNDPSAAPAERAAGRTSDAANRDAGVLQGDVPPDRSEGTKPSDAGPEAYPFPPGGDVEVATIDSADQQGEFRAPLEAEDWVILDGTSDLVPDRLDGHYAVIVEAPRIMCNCEWAPRTHEHMHPTAGIRVRTRDEANATLVLPFEAFKQVLRGGLRSAATPVGV
jgi:hypothetical protein